MSKALTSNVIERGAWTLAQCALGFLATELAHVSPAYAPMVAAALSFAKNIVAERLAEDRG